MTWKYSLTRILSIPHVIQRFWKKKIFFFFFRPLPLWVEGVFGWFFEVISSSFGPNCKLGGSTATALKRGIRFCVVALPIRSGCWEKWVWIFFFRHFTPLSLCRKKFFFQKTLYDARNGFSMRCEDFWCKFEVKISKIEWERTKTNFFSLSALQEKKKKKFIFFLSLFFPVQNVKKLKIKKKKKKFWIFFFFFLKLLFLFLFFIFF